MPARLSAIIQALKAFGIDLEEPSSGSHWKCVRSGKTYTIPAHNGPRTEISNVYINGVCRAFELDVKEFKKKL